MADELIFSAEACDGLREWILQLKQSGHISRQASGITFKELIVKAKLDSDYGTVHGAQQRFSRWLNRAPGAAALEPLEFTALMKALRDSSMPPLFTASAGPSASDPASVLAQAFTKFISAKGNTAVEDVKIVGGDWTIYRSSFNHPAQVVIGRCTICLSADQSALEVKERYDVERGPSPRKVQHIASGCLVRDRSLWRMITAFDHRGAKPGRGNLQFCTFDKVMRRDDVDDPNVLDVMSGVMLDIHADTTVYSVRYVLVREKRPRRLGATPRKSLPAGLRRYMTQPLTQANHVVVWPRGD